MIVSKDYKYVNPEYINEMADGENDFIIQVIDIYLTTIPESIHKLAEAASGNDYTAILFCTHRLRGSLNFIGGSKLIGIIDKIDALCNARTALPAIGQLVGQVVAILKDITLELNEILEDVKKQEEV